ncbi:hypothetical protein FDB15_12895 [Clostridium botulinum]|uniref:three component ABC system middle component n=1 Tax=unclassified Clostridium TaxID=2614128 RepID=UPI0004FFDF48|nr:MULTISPECIES: three component ABC system middle component [unclassified Clostridium]KFX55322.1 hypothetical protein KU40_08850 [Clostridium botulinum]MBY6777843.1 hypothetical protein [Clostridium botulinum]MBY6851250.1 hypothetical protein [Clostridium botulinum]MBY7008653.1 hypothetical protein [Clostridium botulinum]NFF24120.1 hypothetical protein [Clostridium botulinum]
MINYIYNNEAIGVVAIYSVIKELEEIEYSKAMLILPLMLNDKLIKFIGRANTKVRGIEELIIKKGQALTSFNEFYLEMLPISINSLIILNEMKVIEIENGTIRSIKKELKVDLDVSKRTKSMLKSVEGICEILKMQSENLYLQLRVIL